MFLDRKIHADDGIIEFSDMADRLVIDLTLDSEAEDQVSAFSSVSNQSTVFFLQTLRYPI